MAIISLIGSKGGVGTSLVATNIGAVLAGKGSVVLIDLHPGSGTDDLLLDSSADKDWSDLLTVLNELQRKHIDLATSEHSSGLRLISGPESWQESGDPESILKLVRSVAEHFDFCIVDLPGGLSAANQAVLATSDVTLLITTADPPALRCAKRFADGLKPEAADRIGLVINQINRQHPLTPGQIAESLNMHLLATLPPDPRAIGYQIHFGQVCVMDPSSMFGRATRELAERLRQSAAGRLRTAQSSNRGGES
jgi:pilus assembly protein CpaE